MANYSYFVFVFICFVSVCSDKLPSYIKPCSKSDPNFLQCALKNGQQAIPSIAKGDKSYRIPNLQPLFIPKIAFDATHNLRINLQDNNIYGLEDSSIKDVDLDYKNHRFKFVVFVPKLTLIGKYDINGRILILPIQGNGPANITFTDAIFNYQYDYILKPKGGKNYQHIANNKVTYDVSRAYFKLENLFNGDKRLGVEMNRFMDENWREIMKDIGPALGDTVGEIINSIISQILKKVSDDEFFLD